MNDSAPEQIRAEDWAGEMGEKWNTYAEQFESMISACGEAAIAYGAFEPGETVIDIGCGAGPSALDIAKRVAPGGRVVGLDISPVLIDTARARAAASNADNVRFVVGNAAICEPPDRFDTLFSRFGVMFFEDSDGAFRNMARFVKPGGRLVLCVWGPPAENPWVGDMMAVVRRHVDVPPPDPRAPGPFAFADTQYVRDILTQAGFRNIEFTSRNVDLYLGGRSCNATEAARFAVDVLFVGDALADASERTSAAVIDEINGLMRRHETADGVVLRGNIWLITARI